MSLHLPDAVRAHARKRGTAPAVSCEDRTLTYAELDSRTNRLARALLDGADPGSRIGVLARTRIEPGEVMIASAKAGLVAVPLNWRLAAPELVAVARDADLKILITAPEFVTGALAIRAAVPGLSLIVIDGDGLEDPAYETWLAGYPDDDPGRGCAEDADAVTLQIYTSGTTGLPKGVLLTLRGLSPSREELDVYRWDAESVAFNALPLFHLAGAGWLSVALTCGAHSLMIPDLVPQTAVDIMEREGVTHSMLVPSVLHLLTELPGIERRDFSRLRMIVYGSSPITPTLLRRSLTVFGCGFMGKYGLTETTGTVTQLAPEDHDLERPHLLRSVGRARSGVELMIADLKTGEPVPPGTVGEIRTRSPYNTPGYWNRPNDTAALFTADGWLRTGDGGHLDTDGHLYLTDRVKDMIITGGENVYPIEVESALAEHPAVSEVAVIGVPHDLWGEAVTAVIVLRPAADPPSEQQLIDFARQRVASYKKPKRVLFATELPRNASGKVLKRELRASAPRDNA